jgi:hypothetical protein
METIAALLKGWGTKLAIWPNHKDQKCNLLYNKIITSIQNYFDKTILLKKLDESNYSILTRGKIKQCD